MTIGFGLGKVRLGGDAFARATRDWIERGADSEHVWSSMEVAERLKPVDDDTLLAEATFKLALHFEAVGDSERARRHFAAAQHLAPDNWNYLRQGWTHKGTAYAYMKVLTRTNDLRKNSDKSYYDPMGLPGEEPSPVYRARVAVDTLRSGGSSNCSAASATAGQWWCQPCSGWAEDGPADGSWRDSSVRRGAPNSTRRGNFSAASTDAASTSMS